MNSRAIKRATTTTDDDGNDAETTDTTPVYATFAEDVTGFFGKWNLQPNAPRSKRLGSPARDGGRGVVLGGKDIAGRPANFGAKRPQRLNENCRLDGHVDRSSDARPGERLGIAVFLAHFHQPGHLMLGQANLIASEFREG